MIYFGLSNDLNLRCTRKICKKCHLRTILKSLPFYATEVSHQQFSQNLDNDAYHHIKAIKVCTHALPMRMVQYGCLSWVRENSLLSALAKRLVVARFYHFYPLRVSCSVHSMPDCASSSDINSQHLTAMTKLLLLLQFCKGCKTYPKRPI